MAPQQLGTAMQGFLTSKEGFLLFVVLVFFLLGFVMEGVAAMIMLVPILFPVGRIFGVEEHHLALIIVMAVQIALITPPMAIALFIVTPMAGCTIREVSIEVIPFIGIVLFLPGVAMWLPNLVM
jgi:TRAP-type C4-dicarboxylate transport system permease large subunit